MIIYVLRLQQGKFYVGTTNKTIHERFEEHQSGKSAAAWTRIYPPINVLYVITTTHRGFENIETLKCMEMYGVDNVRGGSYSKIMLTFAEIKSIQQQLLHNSGRCYRCGGEGHFANRCDGSSRYIASHANRYTLSDLHKEPRFARRARELVRRHTGRNFISGCAGCCRNTHRSDECHLKRSVYGCMIYDKSQNKVFSGHGRERLGQLTMSDCKTCGQTTHGTSDCRLEAYAGKHSLGNRNEIPKKIDDLIPRMGRQFTFAGCTRCGRQNHTIDSCYATTHIRGGSYSKLMMAASETNTDSHENQMSHRFSLCQRCGRKGHCTAKCFASTHFSGTLIFANSNVGVCFRCGRRGHYVKNCFAFTHLNGQYIGKRKCL